MRRASLDRRSASASWKAADQIRCKQVLDDSGVSSRDRSRRANAARRYRAGAEVLRRHMPVGRDDRMFEDAQAGRVSLSLGDFSFRPADFVDEGFQYAAIRIADIFAIVTCSPGGITICPVNRCCAQVPDFIATRLANERCRASEIFLPGADLGSDQHDRVWTFVGRARRASIRIDGSFDSNSALALRKAAVAGWVLRFSRNNNIAAELTSGTLLRVLPQHEVRRPVTALYARSPHIPQKVRLLVSFLVQWFKNERARSYA